MALREGEANQRSQFQFEIFRLNLIANAGLIAFALNSSEEWTQALLACPLISLVLFSMWFHHGIVIKIETEELNQEQDQRASRPVLSFLRQLSVSVAVLGNFVLVPMVALSIFQVSKSSWVIPLAIGTLAMTGVLYLLWFVANYFTKGIHATPSKAVESQPPPTN